MALRRLRRKLFVSSSDDAIPTKTSTAMKGNRTKGSSRVGNLGGNKTHHPSKDSIKMAFKIRAETAKNLRENIPLGHLSDFVSDAIDEKLRRSGPLS
jgi:hypothetical protein